MSIENTELSSDSTAGTAAPNESTTSMDDTLKNAYRAAMANGAVEDEGTDTGQEDPPAGRQRGPDGKFVAKAKDEAAAPTQAAAATQETQADDTPAETTPQNSNPDNLYRVNREGQRFPVDITKAPETWRSEAKAVYDALPEWARREVHKREQDVMDGIRQYKDAAGFGSQMAQELLPYQQTMTQMGVQPREVVKQLAAAWNTLATGNAQQKANMMLQLMNDYGIDFTSLGTDPQQGTAQTQDDPRLATALQRIEKLEGTLTAQERQRVEAEYSAHVEAVNRFGADPKHKHFNAVRKNMAALIESGQSKDLEDAYDKALWITPEVRKLMLAEQEKERANKAAADAAAARKAAGANVTRRGTPPVPPKTGTMDDTIKARFRELTAS